MAASKFSVFLSGFKFAANAKVNKLLKAATASDIELAIAVKTTKPYYEDKDLQTKVAEIMAGKTEVVEKPTPKPVPTNRGGEYR